MRLFEPVELPDGRMAQVSADESFASLAAFRKHARTEPEKYGGKKWILEPGKPTLEAPLSQMKLSFKEAK